MLAGLKIYVLRAYVFLSFKSSPLTTVTVCDLIIVPSIYVNAQTEFHWIMCQPHAASISERILQMSNEHIQPMKLQWHNQSWQPPSVTVAAAIFHLPPPADLPVAIKVRVRVILQVPVKTTPLYSKTTAANAGYDALASILQRWTTSDVWWCEESKEDLWQRLFTGDNRQAAIQPPTHQLQI